MKKSPIDEAEQSVSELVSRLRERIRNASTPRLGKFGEKIYASHMQAEGYRLSALHEQKADFLVEGIGRVDVKTRGLGKTTARTRQRVAKTWYCFVDLMEDGIHFVHEDEGGAEVPPAGVIAWQQALEYLERTDYVFSSGKSELKEFIHGQLEGLKLWISVHWMKSAAIIYREGRSTQQSMANGKNPWGPVTFHEPPHARRTVDLKVLLYFDGPEIYEVFAYPISRRSEINWIPSRTNDRAVSFDPATLDTKFKFNSLEEFKSSFLERFPFCED